MHWGSFVIGFLVGWLSICGIVAILAVIGGSRLNDRERDSEITGDSDNDSTVEGGDEIDSVR